VRLKLGDGQTKRGSPLGKQRSVWAEWRKDVPRAKTSSSKKPDREELELRTKREGRGGEKRE